jgi:hypothetical protein
VHENYKGRKLHFSSDIALVKLNVSVELTWAVLPVCVDWQNQYERFQLSNGSLGVVSLLEFEISYYFACTIRIFFIKIEAILKIEYILI